MKDVLRTVLDRIVSPARAREKVRDRTASPARVRVKETVVSRNMVKIAALTAVRAVRAREQAAREDSREEMTEEMTAARMEEERIVPPRDVRTASREAQAVRVSVHPRGRAVPLMPYLHRS